MEDHRNPQNLLKLIEICRKKGVSSLKLSAESVEFELSPAALFPESTYKKNKKALSAEGVSSSDPIVEGELSAEDILYWSSTPASELEERGH